MVLVRDGLSPFHLLQFVRVLPNALTRRGIGRKSLDSRANPVSSFSGDADIRESIYGVSKSLRRKGEEGELRKFEIDKLASRKKKNSANSVEVESAPRCGLYEFEHYFAGGN